ncbi:MAG: RsmE family RNA methyltransferase, partial [bacterium]
PEITLHPLFKPFVEDVVPLLSCNTSRLVADPGGVVFCPAKRAGPISLVIGPEGGFTPYELAALTGQGFTPVTLGPRILKTEQAVPAFLGRLM